MNRRQAKLAVLAEQVREAEMQLYIGKITGEQGGEYQVTVNGRTVARQALASSEFAFASQGPSSRVGEHVVLASSTTADLCFIQGSSPYII